MQVIPAYNNFIKKNKCKTIDEIHPWISEKLKAGFYIVI